LDQNFVARNNCCASSVGSLGMVPPSKVVAPPPSCWPSACFLNIFPPPAEVAPRLVRLVCFDAKSTKEYSPLPPLRLFDPTWPLPSGSGPSPVWLNLARTNDMGGGRFTSYGDDRARWPPGPPPPLPCLGRGGGRGLRPRAHPEGIPQQEGGGGVGVRHLLGPQLPRPIPGEGREPHEP